MTNREQEILTLLKTNPMISQNALADALHITRSSVAVHITNLMKKGYILGKGYILKSERYVCVIGGSNVDIQGSPRDTLIPRDSNIGDVKISLGGVGRNIAENLQRLGVETSLISVVGDDAYGQKILEESRLIGLNMMDTLVLHGAMSSVYLCILDDRKDMALAVSSMDIYDSMTVNFIKSKRHVIENAALCILDTNVPADVLEYVLSTFRSTPFFLDPVSTGKSKKVADLIGRFHTIKPNRLEAEILSGVAIQNDGDLQRAADVFHEKGVAQVFISLGRDGVFCSTPDGHEHIKAPDVAIVNATGAGDAFMAALALGYLRDMDAFQSARLGSAAAAIALAHENTINPTMSADNLFNKAKELGLC
ncbi:pseudouridine kinase [Sporobacter termitidis DSM 10068]|uniref:Pseudouridine kinase n=1 Tax=Sporobacter termitidis DSM 10068 TaxID=1123282 RepID=A0A1M5WH56_9FIRM|nr:PfkB family carbohydrate kinase [Sporobacter termitidis]SHH86861.1 pseudouridine kinase [Sporobacter termitidis DSM 10068]